MNLLIFQNPYEFFQFFLRFSKYRFGNKIEAITVQLLVQSLGKFLCVIWNLGIKSYPKFVTLRAFFKIFEQNFKNVKKIEKIQMDSEKSINLF